MRAHLVQYDIAWEDRGANTAKIESMLASTALEAGDLVLLPEMFDTGFSFRLDVTADDDGVSAAWLADFAKRHGVTVQGGISVRRPDGKGINRALVYGPSGQLLGHYDKVHPFTFGREGEYFVGGGEVTTFPLGAGLDPLVTCPAICYDLRFPELFRAGLALGAECFTLGANWPVDRQFHWRTLAIARAIENQALVLAVNRTGADPHLRYAGGSIAIDAKGQILAEAKDEEAVLSVEIDSGAVREWRQTFPAWRDQSPALARFDPQKASKSV